jgi:superfamily II RNA helicase
MDPDNIIRDKYNLPLTECTISELWEIVMESNLMQKGLKSRLVRKQDIIDFLQGEKRHLHGPDPALSMTNEAPTPDEQQTITPPEVTATDDNDVRDEMLRLDSPKPVSVAFNIAPLVQENMVHHGLTSLLPIQAKAYSAIHSGTDVVLQAPTGSGTLRFFRKYI